MLQKTATVRMVETHRSWRHPERSHQILGVVVIVVVVVVGCRDS
jgi:hypothetical protein